MGKLRKGYDKKKKKAQFQQKRVDMLICVDMVRLATIKAIDEIILVAGDDDFVPAVKTAKDYVNVVLVHHKNNASDELKQNCDECIEITEDYITDCIRKRL